MKKSEILKTYSDNTGISYKHTPLFVGDVYRGELGVEGVVIAKTLDDGSKKYYFKKTNNCEHALPECRAGLNNGTFVANVVQDEALMQKFIDAGIIEDDENNEETETMENENKVETAQEVVTPPPSVAPPVVEEKTAPAKKATKTKKAAEKPAENPAPVEEEKEVKPAPKAGQKEVYISIHEKINNVRAAWKKSNIDKEGSGRAGGNSRYEYYKPQQIIDFCLEQEIKQGLFSAFNVGFDGKMCSYTVKNLTPRPTINGGAMFEEVTVSCPFDIPRKMACSEAQQVGAAMTYYNRRLAMMMYKIEDNSKESVDVLEDADYSTLEIPAPPANIPAPPIAETQAIPAPPVNIQAEATSEPVSESKPQNDVVVPPTTENAKSANVAGEIEQKEEVVQAPPPVVEEKEILPPPPQTTQTVPPPPAATAAPQAPAQEAKVEQSSKTGSIEDLY